MCSCNTLEMVLCLGVAACDFLCFDSQVLVRRPSGGGFRVLLEAAEPC